MPQISDLRRADSPRRPAVPDGPFLVLGLGEAGRAAAGALIRRGRGGEVVAFDHRSAAVPRRVRHALAAEGVEVRIGAETEPLDRPVPRTVIKSPGVPIDSPVVREARRRGADVIDELELGWRLSESPLVAVTGTNGKTTTAALASALLEAAGLSAPLAGNADIAPALSAIAGAPDAIVCEASSFQLEACADLLPEVGVFTNLTPDHLTRHGTMRRYGEVKRSLFIKRNVPVPLAIVDALEEPGRRLADDVELAGGRVIRLGGDRGAAYRLLEARWNLDRAELRLQTPGGALRLCTNLPGAYNARNVALAIALADALELPRASTLRVLEEHPGPRGRFEHVGRSAAGARLILDTAATPAAVRQFLLAVRAAMGNRGRLHAVIGVLGSREPAQRQAVGRIAATLSDRVLLTSGSYRARPALATMDELLTGARAAGANSEVLAVERRGDAIGAAADGAVDGDVVCVLGRGNLEEAVDGETIDDRRVMRRLAAGWTLGRSGPERAPQSAPRELPV